MEWTEPLIAEVRSAINGAPRGQKRATARRIAESLGCSWQTVYAKADVTRGRKKCPRSPEIEPKFIDMVAQLKAEGERMGAQGRELTTEDAIAILEQAGKVEPGLLTVATVNRRLRERGYRQPRAYARHEDEYVNQVHQMDFSRSEYFEVTRMVDGEYMVAVDGRRGTWNYKNKPKAERLRLWVVSYIDTYSRAQLVRYYAETGENLLMATRFLQFAWQRSDEAHPFNHPPIEVLKLDQGAVGKNAQFRDRLEEHLDIRVELAAAKNDRLAEHQSMGKVERKFRSLWLKELKWATVLKKKGVKEIRLTELNTLAHDWCVARLSAKHPVRSETIGQVYRTGLRMAPQRTIKTDIFSILYTEDTRTVSATADIQIDNQLYKVPEKYVLQKVYFYVNADGEMKGSSLDKKETFDLVPFDPAAEKGKRLHTPTYKELSGREELALDGRNLRLTETPKEDLPANVHTLGAEETEQAPDTPFEAKPREDVFEDWDEAKLYICQCFNGCRWSDLTERTQGMFKDLFDIKRLSRQAVEELAQTAS